MQLGDLVSAVSFPRGAWGSQQKSDLVHFRFKIWHLLATVLMIFPKLYQPEKSQPKLTRLFFFSSVAVGLFLEWA